MNVSFLGRGNSARSVERKDRNDRRNMTKEYSEPPTQGDGQTQKTLSELLDEIESRANAATSGPWLYDGRSYAIGHQRHMLRADGIGVSQPDATFIAAARSDVPKLVKALRKMIATRADDSALESVAQLLREPADSVQTKEEVR